MDHKSISPKTNTVKYSQMDMQRTKDYFPWYSIHGRYEFYNR
jgi:hypothetical protein